MERSNAKAYRGVHEHGLWPAALSEMYPPARIAQAEQAAAVAALGGGRPDEGVKAKRVLGGAETAVFSELLPPRPFLSGAWFTTRGRSSS